MSSVILGTLELQGDFIDSQTLDTCRERGVRALNSDRHFYFLAYSEPQKEKKYTDHSKYGRIL